MSWVIDDTHDGMMYNDSHPQNIPEFYFDTSYLKNTIEDSEPLGLHKDIIEFSPDNIFIQFNITDESPIGLNNKQLNTPFKPDNIYIQFDVRDNVMFGLNRKELPKEFKSNNIYIQFIVDDDNPIGLYNKGEIISFSQDVNRYVFLITDDEPAHRTPKRDFHLGGFRDGHMKKVIIPRSCKKIADFAFFNSQINKVKIASDCEYGEFSFPPDCEITFYEDNEEEESSNE